MTRRDAGRPARGRHRPATATGSRSTTSTSTHPAGLAAGRSSGRTARARARCSRSSPGCCRSAPGRVEVLGGPPGQHARRVAYVPQAEVVDWDFPVTVGDVVMMGRVPARSASAVGPDGRTARRSTRALETVGMSRQRDRQIGALSGGQRRRVFLARALAARAGPVPARRAGDRGRRHDPGGPDGRPRGARPGRARRSSRRPTTWPCAAQRFHQAAFVNGRIVAHGPARTWSSTSGCWPRRTAATCSSCPSDRRHRSIIDDAHHHDQPPGQRAALPRRGALTMLDFLLDPMTLRLHAARPGRGASWSGSSARSWARSSCCKGLAFIGDAVSHAAFPGLVIAYHASGSRCTSAARSRRSGRPSPSASCRARGEPPLRHRRRRAVRGHVRVRRRSCSARSRATSTDLFSYLLGNVLGITSADLVQVAVLGALVLVIVVVLRKELLYATFDPAGCGGVGPAGRRASSTCCWPSSASRSWSASRRSGIILVVAMLVTPAATRAAPRDPLRPPDRRRHRASRSCRRSSGCTSAST